MRVDDVLARLHGVTGSDGQWYAKCPAHDDGQASLAIALGRDGRILLTCWAGCELDAITHALGVSVSDLFADANGARSPWGTGSLGAAVKRLSLVPTDDDVVRWRDSLLADPVALDRIRELKGWTKQAVIALDIGMRGDRLTIPVRNPDGEIVQVLRYWPESRPKVLATKGAPRVPVIAIADDTRPIWIVEGETDAVSMVSMGFNVIAAPGASAKARVEWLDVVRGRVVYVCFDVDDPGRRAAQRWGRACRDAGAAHVYVVELTGPTGYDVGNVLVEAETLDDARAQLAGLAEHADEWREPLKATHETRAQTNGEPVDVDVESSRPGQIIRRPLSTVRTRAIYMLWRDRIPRGRVGIVYGSPGQGKSTLMAMLAAEITGEGGRVMIASAEESVTSTITPRMVGAGADLGLVELISTRANKGGETSLVLPRDLDELGAQMADVDLLVIDPLTAHLGDDVNGWSDQSVRSQVFAPLTAHAEETDCAVALLMHMNKASGQDPLSRIGGSVGFGAAARFALLFGAHPSDVWLDEGERRQVLVHVKASESPRQRAMVLRRRSVGVDVDEGDVSSVPVLEIVDEQARIAAESVLAIPSGDDSGAFVDAIEFLRAELGDGPKLAKQLLKTARERGDFSERTLRDAKRALDVKSAKDAEGWWWERPAQSQR